MSVQRWTGIVQASDAGGFVAVGDYLKAQARIAELETQLSEFSKTCASHGAATMSADMPKPVAHLLSGRGYFFSQLNPPSKYQVEKCGLSGEGLFTEPHLREYAEARVGEVREQVDELTHEKGQLRAYVDNLRANIRRLDGLIEEVGGCTFSCINTYDDLKNSLIGLKRQRDKLQSQLATLRAAADRLRDALFERAGDCDYEARLIEDYEAAREAQG